jgi:hypothetical protein
MTPEDKKMLFWVVIIAILVTGVIAYAKIPEPAPHENVVVNKTTTATDNIVKEVVPSSSSPTRVVTPRPTPTPKPRMPLTESSIQSIFEIDFGGHISGIPAEERALILGKEDPKWQSAGRREIAYNSMIGFQLEKKKKVTSIEGTFERFIYSVDGVTYLARNVSVTSGTIAMLNKYGITMYAGEFDNQEGGKDKFVNAYLGDPSGDVVPASGTGSDLKTDIHSRPFPYRIQSFQNVNIFSAV